MHKRSDKNPVSGLNGVVYSPVALLLKEKGSENETLYSHTFI